LLLGVVMSRLQPHVDLEIVCELNARDSLQEYLSAISPDFMLLGLFPGETDVLASFLLAAAPSTKILAVARNGDRAWLHEMRPHRMALPDLSANDLKAALYRTAD
jgi:hypothetical protein